MEQQKGGVTRRACRNTLGRLKVQLLFRLLFVGIGLIPMIAGFGAWRMWLVILATTIWAVPEVLLLFLPEFGAGILNTDRAYDCIGYEGFFPKRKLDALLADWNKGKKALLIAIALLVGAGFALNIRSIVRICASYIDIDRYLPHEKGSFKAIAHRFMQGLGVIFAAFFLWFCLATVMGNGLSDLIGRTARDPYRFRHSISQEAKEEVLTALEGVVREDNYFYYVNIPFNENGFAYLADGRQSATYLAQISHSTGNQEMWEIRLTLNEHRSAAWSDDAAIVHPVRFDTESGEEAIYVSGDDALTLHYRDDSGAYVQVALEEAPESYQFLARHILLDDAVLEQMRSDHENLAMDNGEGLIHVRYETETCRITIGLKDSRFPYEMTFRDGDFAYETLAIRFDPTHSFNLP